jgi:selenoprotein W-related protein
LAEELTHNYTPSIESLTLIPSSGGRFEVMAGDTLIYSKKETGRHAEAGEVIKLFEAKTGAIAQPFT